MHGRYGDSRAVTPTTNQPGFWQTIGDQIPGLARGAYSGLLGLPGDVEEIAMAASPYALLSQGKISPQRFSNLATQEYSPGLLTSEEIADPLRKEGLLSKRPLEGEYTELAGMFLSPDMFVGDIAKLGALGVGASIFTSPAQKAVREVAQEALPSQQWLKQLEGRGVKKDELEWTGLLNFLKEKKGNIQKSEVEDFIEANKIDVQEVVRGGPLDPTFPEIRPDSEYAGPEVRRLLENSNRPDDFRLQLLNDSDAYQEIMSHPKLARMERSDDPALTDEVFKDLFGENQTELEEIWQYSDAGHTKFGEYQLPGGENYRELVLTLPNTKLEKAGRELAEFEKQFKSKPIPDQYWGEEKRLRQAIADAKNEAGTFAGGHFPEDNILSWVRFNERVDPDGNKVLFIEEIQSDWAQKGRKIGFGSLLDSAEKIKLKKELSEKQAQFEDVAKKYFEGISEPGREQNDLLHQINVSTQSDFAKYLGVPNDEASRIFNLPMEMGALDNRLAGTGQGSGVPRAPFLEDTNQWAGLSMKRMIKWASDEGFDSIAWTTGKQQAKRYDLSKHINEIHYSGSDLSALDHNGMEVIIKTGVHPDDLADYIGKEAAAKLMKQPKTEVYKSRKVRSLKGQDLEIGGEGMAGFYDKILVDQANKIGKKYGAKVEKGHADAEMARRGAIQTVIDDTPKWRITVGDEIDNNIPPFDNFDEAKEYLLKTDTEVPGTVWTMKLPDKLKEAAKEGLPYYALVPPGLLAVGAQRERQSLLE